MNAYRVETATASVPLKAYLPQWVDVPRIGALCAACPDFGGRWCCPPFDFDPLALWGRYDTLILYARRLFPRAGTAAGAALADLEAEKAALHSDLLTREAATPGSLALAPGSCTVCSQGCARVSGVPCHRPQAMRFSIEALGGDVAAAAEHCFGWPLLWIRDGAVPQYLTLVGGLLTGGPV